MAIYEPKSAHLREVLLFAFNWKKSATEAHRMLEEVYSDHALSKSQCYRWFKKFQSGDFELDNEPHGKPPQKFEDAGLQALLDEDSTQMQEKLAKQLQIYGLCPQVYKYVYKLFANCVANLPFRSQAAPLAVKMGGEATLDRSNVYRWYKMFSEGREDVNDEERAGRPSTSTTDEKINEVEKMILVNRRITVREVAEDLNISIGSCHSIFINDLGMRRVAAKFRVITGDKAWVYGYDVETKAQSSQWKLPHEPRPKEARQVRSNVKVLLTVFFDCRGVVNHEFLPQGRTVNKEYYLQVMRNLREAIRQKLPDLWKNKNWLLHHDNAPAHTSLLVRDFLAKNNTLMMPQPPYSPDLAPCDFFLFPKLKRPMKGRRYTKLDEIKTASKEELKNIFF
ncbi:hypothetical protein LAZ67_8003173 [Cordylochernes scorpioides]|uniref:Mos1 transposase HTH domain-containing protein n=1 Tax=Cordylochernes scorpioides TaxID=51811 RepID=A0ABY6KRG9_9ARAC|nr:hypothetical protein LAZ67_8003173 [Cordylochernes scorpioides]